MSLGDRHRGPPAGAVAVKDPPLDHALPRERVPSGWREDPADKPNLGEVGLHLDDAAIGGEREFPELPPAIARRDGDGAGELTLGGHLEQQDLRAGCLFVVALGAVHREHHVSAPADADEADAGHRHAGCR